MKKELMPYASFARFLKDALGENFEVSLVDADDVTEEISEAFQGPCEKTALNPDISGLLGDILAGTRLKDQDYMCGFSGTGQSDAEHKHSVFNIKNDKGEIAGFLCIDERRQELYMVKEVFEEFLMPEGSQGTSSESISREVDSLLKERITQIWLKHKTQAASEKLKKAEKIAFIEELFDMGIFRIRGAAAMVAEVSGISQASVYRYLGEIIEE